jgi:predicted Zn-dependent protease
MANHSIRYGEGTDAVINTAAQIDNLGDDFFQEYSELFKLIESELDAVWSGSDYDALRHKAQQARPHFDSMRNVISEYATFLRNTARAHEDRMQDSRNQANSNCGFGD